MELGRFWFLLSSGPQIFKSGSLTENQEQQKRAYTGLPLSLVIKAASQEQEQSWHVDALSLGVRFILLCCLPYRGTNLKY